jgi:carboxymethylenebutenolidase
MAEWLRSSAADGHEFLSYQALPTGRPRGGLVVVQEIFGVTRHIREVAEDFAAEGYRVVAPAFFDRIRRGVELDYTDVATGRELMGQLDWSATVLDLEAAVAALAPAGKVGVVGYCWGGTVAYVAACRTGIAAAVSYYGGRIPQFLDERPRCPVQYHFGARDSMIPPATIDAIRRADPTGTFFVYEDAGHGFNCTDRADYAAAAAALARGRTLDFLNRHVG